MNERTYFGLYFEKPLPVYIYITVYFHITQLGRLLLLMKDVFRLENQMQQVCISPSWNRTGFPSCMSTDVCTTIWWQVTETCNVMKHPTVSMHLRHDNRWCKHGQVNWGRLCDAPKTSPGWLLLLSNGSRDRCSESYMTDSLIVNIVITSIVSQSIPFKLFVITSFVTFRFCTPFWHYFCYYVSWYFVQHWN